MNRLLSTSLKIEKSNKSGLGYLTKILYLAPAKLSGWNVCSYSSNGCVAGCLNTSGRGRYNKIQQSRLKKTKWLMECKDEFLNLLFKELRNFTKFCEKKGYKPAIRLNGTSDIGWEKISLEIFTQNPEIQFYDYTKNITRMLRYLNGELPSNYHLTFSRSENNDDYCDKVLKLGGNVAVVFANPPPVYKGITVHCGDTTDLRFLDNPGVIALSPKGRAKKDKSGFVIWKN